MEQHHDSSINVAGQVAILSTIVYCCTLLVMLGGPILGVLAGFGLLAMGFIGRRYVFGSLGRSMVVIAIALVAYFGILYITAFFFGSGDRAIISCLGYVFLTSALAIPWFWFPFSIGVVLGGIANRHCSQAEQSTTEEMVPLDRVLARSDKYRIRRALTMWLPKALGAIATVSLLVAVWIFLSDVMNNEVALATYSSDAVRSVDGPPRLRDGADVLLRQTKLRLERGHAYVSLRSAGSADLEGPAVVQFDAPGIIHVSQGKVVFNCVGARSELIVSTERLLAVGRNSAFSIYAEKECDTVRGIAGVVKLNGVTLCAGQTVKVGTDGNAERIDIDTDKKDKALKIHDLIQKLDSK